MSEPERKMTTIELLDPQVAAILATKTPAERLQMGFAANRFVRERLRAYLRQQHSDWTEDQISVEIARRMLWNSST